MRKIHNIKINHRLIILFLAIIILLLLGIFILQSAKKSNPLDITLNRGSYKVGDSMKIIFKNVTSKNVCFSANYPYSIEQPKKDNLTHQYTWEPLYNNEHLEKDVVESCIPPAQSKTFLISLSQMKKGHYRLSIQVCLNCQKGELFHKSKELYSPEFDIK